MSLLSAWAILPLLFAALGCGCGLLLAELAGVRLPGPLLLPAGFAVVVVVASLTTANETTAGLTSPVLVALAIAGAGLALPFRPHPDWWAAGAALAVFAAYAAPIVLSGSASFAGYIALDDTATWLAYADSALVNGRDVAELVPSSFSTVLNDGRAYPYGSFVPLGVGAQLTGQDGAWLFQPYLAFLASLLALCLYELVGPLLPRRPLRALVAGLGAQPALLYGYAFWSGIKELMVAFLVALLAALAAVALARGWQARGQLPLAVAAAAVLVCLSALGAIWLAGLTLFAALLVWLRGPRRASLALAAAAGLALLLAAPTLVSAWQFVRGAAASDAGTGAVANLLDPLSQLQLLGIWPAGDFRRQPPQLELTYLLLCLLVGAAGFALVTTVRRRLWGLPLYAAVAIGGWGCVALFEAAGRGSPWLTAKALATASPCLLAAALAGAAMLAGSARTRTAVAGAVALAALAGGVLWSNSLTYGQVWLAPRGQLAELELVGERFAGGGPALMTEYQPYGVRHFLRRLDPEGASERRARPVSLRAGGMLDKAQYADLDAFDLGALLVYRTLVLRSSPLASRPPSPFLPVWSGRFYEVWQQLPAAAVVLEHLPLGDEVDPEGVPDCAQVLRLAALAAGQGGALLTASRRPPQLLDLAAAASSAGWLPGVAAGSLRPDGSGAATTALRVATGGRLSFWLGGSFRGRVQLSVDGRPVGSARHHLEATAQLTPLGSELLRAGPHLAELRYEGPGWRPGSRGAPFLLGPLAVGAPASASRILRVVPAEASSLCGRRLDWVEAVAPELPRGGNG